MYDKLNRHDQDCGTIIDSSYLVEESTYSVTALRTFVGGGESVRLTKFPLFILY